MKEKIIHFMGWMIGILVVLVIIYGSFTMSRKVISTSVKEEKIVVILDAGHGGSDPGKVGVNGALEKDINLAIVEKVQEILENEGIATYLTRDSDKRFDGNGEEFSKTLDMKNRVEIVNEIRPELVVSVHQNSYSSEQIKGGQVFYYQSSEESKTYAHIMQEAIREVDKENKRQAKGNDTYYLLKKTEVPTIIVECGFLSNWEEAEKLSQEAYQNDMAKAIAQGIKSCLESTSQNEKGGV